MANAGTLPEEWDSPLAFPKLQVLVLENNNLTGTLPSNWGNQGFTHLNTLWLGKQDLHGSLPATWAGGEAFLNLQQLALDNTNLSGDLPRQWTTPQAFPSLSVVNLSRSDLQGPLPAFDNVHLNVLDVEFCNFDGMLDESWNSLASFTAIKASHNNLSGSLPDTPGCLSQLTSTPLLLSAS